MENDLTFSNFLKDITSKIDNKNLRSGVISICNEIPNLKSLSNYSNLLMKYSFSVFWEEEDNLSFIALDKCKYINLDGPNRFKMAEEFHFENLKNLINIDQNSDPSSSPKIIYFFSYSDNFDINGNSKNVPNLEAILPKILIANKLVKVIWNYEFWICVVFLLEFCLQLDFLMQIPKKVQYQQCHKDHYHWVSVQYLLV